jgi:hypothetical protein
LIRSSVGSTRSRLRRAVHPDFRRKIKTRRRNCTEQKHKTWPAVTQKLRRNLSINCFKFTCLSYFSANKLLTQAVLQNHERFKIAVRVERKRPFSRPREKGLSPAKHFSSSLSWTRFQTLQSRSTSASDRLEPNNPPHSNRSTSSIMQSRCLVIKGNI